MRQILFFTISIIFLVGCGGGSSSGSSSGTSPAPPPEPPVTPEPPSSDVTMVLSESYTVYPGDQVLKMVPEALLQIIHNDEHNESTVVLLEGNATIIRQEKK